MSTSAQFITYRKKPLYKFVVYFLLLEICPTSEIGYLKAASFNIKPVAAARVVSRSRQIDNVLSPCVSIFVAIWAAAE